MTLENAMRQQVFDRNEELQKVLNHTHAMLIENSDIADNLRQTVYTKLSGGADPALQSKRINYSKEDGYVKARE